MRDTYLDFDMCLVCFLDSCPSERTAISRGEEV